MLCICCSYADDSQLGVDKATPLTPPHPPPPTSDFALATNSSLLCRHVGVHVWERPNSVHVRISAWTCQVHFKFCKWSRIAGWHHYKRQKALIQDEPGVHIHSVIINLSKPERNHLMKCVLNASDWLCGVELCASGLRHTGMGKWSVCCLIARFPLTRHERRKLWYVTYWSGDIVLVAFLLKNIIIF